MYAGLLDLVNITGFDGPMWWGIPTARLVVYGYTEGVIDWYEEISPGHVDFSVDPPIWVDPVYLFHPGLTTFPSRYSVTLRGKNKRGQYTTIQTWTGDIPVVSAHDPPAWCLVAIDQEFNLTNPMPDDEYIIFKWSYSISLDYQYYYAALEVPFTPALSPGVTNDHVTGSRIPMGWLMNIRPSILP
jgi:hypothetical protein